MIVLNGQPNVSHITAYI